MNNYNSENEDLENKLDTPELESGQKHGDDE
jgi:hypothetical protein